MIKREEAGFRSPRKPVSSLLIMLAARSDFAQSCRAPPLEMCGHRRQAREPGPVEAGQVHDQLSRNRLLSKERADFSIFGHGVALGRHPSQFAFGDPPVVRGFSPCGRAA
jgi:hypothetical protein